ncbi:MAG TPA: P1 family peptidase, partial [Chitinophagaceae bacterium]|nr:P1 family peptidase [Chitinophagaceae bacterium]
MKQIYFLVLLIFSSYMIMAQNKKRITDLRIRIGVMSPGKLNGITDVPGVKVGHTTLIKGDSIRTGVTAILPHNDNLFQQKVPA